MPRKKSFDPAGAAIKPPLRRYAPFPKSEALLGLACFVLLGLFFRFSDLDLRVAQFMFHPQIPHWPGQNIAPWSWFYRYGQQPAVIAGLLGLGAWIWSLFDPARRAWRGPGLYLFVMLLLGPGLISNVFAKGLAGRPRPEDLLPFGGPWTFLHAFEFGIPGRGKSLISGHASATFYWFTLFFLLRRWHRWLALVLTLLLGALMGWARMSQGAHFLSDIFLSGAAMFTLAACLSPLIDWQPRREFFKRKDLRLALLLGALAWFAIANPIYEQRTLRWVGNPSQAPSSPIATDRIYDWTADSPGLSQTTAVDLRLDVQSGDIRVDFDGENVSEGMLPLVVQEQFQASALPGVKEHFDPQRMITSPAWPMEANELGVSLKQSLFQPFWDAQGLFVAHLPSQKPCEARLKSEQGRITIGTLVAGAQVFVYGNFDARILPQGFEPFGRNGYQKPGPGPLIVLALDASNIQFEP